MNLQLTHSPISSCFAGRMKLQQKTNTSRRNPPKPNLVRHPFFDRPTPWWSVGVAPAYNYIFVPNTHSLSCLDIVEAYCILRLASAACQRHEPSAYFSSICRPFVRFSGVAPLLRLCARRAPVVMPQTLWYFPTLLLMINCRDCAAPPV